MAENKLAQRQYHLDYLRVFASISIILLHVVAQDWYSFEVTSTAWNFYNMCNGATRWGVPVFVMISGALFLPREISVKTLYKKYIFRMAIAYIVWTLFYAIAIPIVNMIFKEGYHITFVEFIGSFISGAYHLWFLPMIIGIYMCFPLIKQLTKNDNLIKYFLMLAFIFCFIKTQFDLVTNNLLSSNIQIVFENITTVFKNFNVNLVFGYVSYFILGFYLNKTEISKKHRTIIYIFGVAGLVLTILLNLFAAKNAGTPSEEFYNSFSLNVFLMSVAIFIWFKYNTKGTERLNKIVISLSKYSFCVYLVHVFIIQSLTAIGFSSETVHPVFSVPATLIFTTVISYFISFILNKIPIIKKYIV